MLRSFFIKLDKKKINVIILMVLFIMILGIKYYVDISAKKEFNPNEVDTTVNKEERDQSNNSNEQEEKMMIRIMKILR